MLIIVFNNLTSFLFVTWFFLRDDLIWVDFECVLTFWLNIFCGIMKLVSWLIRIS